MERDFDLALTFPLLPRPGMMNCYMHDTFVSATRFAKALKELPRRGVGGDGSCKLQRFFLYQKKALEE